MGEADWIDAFATGKYAYSPQQIYDLKVFNDPAKSQVAGQVVPVPVVDQPWGIIDEGIYTVPKRAYDTDEKLARKYRLAGFFGYRDETEGGELYVAKRWAIEAALNSGYTAILQDPEVIEAYNQWLPDPAMLAGDQERRQRGHLPEGLADVLVGGVERPGDDRAAEGGTWPDPGRRGPRRTEDAGRGAGRRVTRRSLRSQKYLVAGRRRPATSKQASGEVPGVTFDVRHPSGRTLTRLQQPPKVLSLPCGDRVESDGESSWLRPPCRIQPELRVLTGGGWSSSRLSDGQFAALLTFPVIIALLAIVGYPSAYSLWMSFHRIDLIFKRPSTSAWTTTGKRSPHPRSATRCRSPCTTPRWSPSSRW